MTLYKIIAYTNRSRYQISNAIKANYIYYLIVNILVDIVVLVTLNSFTSMYRRLK